MTLKSALLSTIALTAVSVFAFTTFANAEEKNKEKEDAPKWDVMNPPGDKRDIDINVDNGTWMSLDVSPDGKTIAFDMLGDIYTMPATGGTATNIASGMAWEIQPRFSPDGKQIAFTSDRAGGDNIWVMDVDGSNPHQITKESFRQKAFHDLPLPRDRRNLALSHPRRQWCAACQKTIGGAPERIGGANFCA